jgi:hypothetical protein
MSPTARTLAALRADGWIAAIVEKWNAHARRRVDLFGIGDVLAIRPGEPVLLIQTTTATNLVARRTKARAEPHLMAWLATGSRFELWAWAKRGARGKPKRWTVTREPVTQPPAAIPGPLGGLATLDLSTTLPAMPALGNAAVQRGCIGGPERPHEIGEITEPCQVATSIRKLGLAVGRSHEAVRHWLRHPAWPAHIARQPPWTPAQVAELRQWAAITLAPDRATAGYGHIQARQSQLGGVVDEITRALDAGEEISDELTDTLSALIGTEEGTGPDVDDVDDDDAESPLDRHLADLRGLLGS